MITSIDLDLCTGCDICIDVCPTDVLRWDEAMQKPVVRYLENCITCYNCELECPCDCIDVSPFRKPLPPVVPYSEGGAKHG